MSTLLRENIDPLLFTTSCRAVNAHRIIASSIPISSSSTPAEAFARYLVAASEMTTSGVTLPTVPEVTQKAVNELRRLSGLTWDQLAKVFNVSRRSLHFWASGQPLSSFNEEQLNRVLGTIQYIDRGNASLNRSLLLLPDSNGNLLLDLLVAGKYEELKHVVGVSDAPQKPQLGSLSEDVYKARMPQNPADLVDALQNPVHREVGRSRPARAARSRKNNSGQ
jgi:DNA-binding transcriptional regulator YiaG